VRVKVDVLEAVVAVPVSGLQRGPAGTFVWLVGGDSLAVVRPVEAGLLTDTVAVIAKGLEPGERIVTTGFARISEGARLVVRDQPVTVPDELAPARRPGGKGKDGERRRRQREGSEGGAASSESAPAAPPAESRPPQGAAASKGPPRGEAGTTR